jgi:hypothetical protein
MYTSNLLQFYHYEKLYYFRFELVYYLLDSRQVYFSSKPDKSLNADISIKFDDFKLL